MRYMLLTLALAATPLWAADLALIDNSGQGNTGIVSLNQAAGSVNQQANLRALALGDAALSQTGLNQVQNAPATNPLAAQPDARAVIQGNAFAGSQGLLGINQTAGSANQSSNLATISVGTGTQSGTAALSDSWLASASTGSQNGSRTVPATRPNASTELSDQAFQGASGVIQLNQIAGTMNHASNSFSLQILPPGQH